MMWWWEFNASATCDPWSIRLKLAPPNSLYCTNARDRLVYDFEPNEYPVGSGGFGGDEASKNKVGLIHKAPSRVGWKFAIQSREIRGNKIHRRRLEWIG